MRMFLSVHVCLCWYACVQVSTLMKLKECEDTHLGEEVDGNWTEVVTQQYMFDRLNREVTRTRTALARNVPLNPADGASFFFFPPNCIFFLLLLDLKIYNTLIPRKMMTLFFILFF